MRTAAVLPSDAAAGRMALAILVPLAAALAQASLIPAVTPLGLRPNLPVVVAGCWSIAAGAGEGAWWAFVGGLASDLLASGPLGALALSALPPVASIGLGARSPARSTGVFAAAALVGGAVLAAALVYAGLLGSTGQPLPPPTAVVADALGSALFSGVIALGAYPAARIIARLTEKRSTFGW
ncbi:MAG: rod shape-determining protein MreD [Candidatus Limnocylindria bacterium]